MSFERLGGVMLPLTTPFDDGRPSLERLRENVELYERLGVDGYLVLGSTGEAALLDPDEKLTLLEASRAAVPSRSVLIAGVGLEATGATVRLAREAANSGVDAVLVITPSYFRAGMTARALEKHFVAVAESSPVPLLLYSVPKFTGLAVPPDLSVRLAEHPNVIGLKDSGEDPDPLLDVIARAPAGFRVLTGHAPLYSTALAAGAKGGILAAADVIPEPFLRIRDLHGAGRPSEAFDLQRRLENSCRVLAGTYGIAGIKYALDLRGLHGGDPRLPLLPLDEPAKEEIGAELEGLALGGLIERIELGGALR
jgi:4-hydroxy-2-oxoglutarate aldolase